MKAARRFLVCLGVMCSVAGCGLWYLRYEQRVEIERYQLGYTQGLEIGSLQQREEFKKNFDCYRITRSGDAAGVVICGVMLPTDPEGNPVVPSAADSSDLEQ